MKTPMTLRFLAELHQRGYFVFAVARSSIASDLSRLGMVIEVAVRLVISSPENG